MKTKSVKKLLQQLNKAGSITPDQAEKLDTHARDQAQAQLESITKMVTEYQKANNANDDKTSDDARQTIEEDPLSVEVRTGWYSPGAQDADTKPAEFTILLCTGGPACRIIGELSEHGEPESARIQYQDWGTPWTEYRLTSDQEETVLTYCRCFYFGD